MQIKLIKPIRTLDNHAAHAWRATIPQLETWMRKDLISILINGGKGIAGISQTEFYKWVSSPEGLSELGIPPTEPPKLLQAYKSAFSVKKGRRFVELLFGDVAKLKMLTPHPAAGTGHLNVTSWLEFAVDNITISKGFVERNKLSGRAQKNIRLNAPLGGLMLSRGRFGSIGTWRFPEKFRNYDIDWLQQNISTIQAILAEKMLELFIIELLK